MHAKIFEGDPGRRSAGHRVPNRTGQQDLATVAREADPSRGVDGQADVAGIRQGGPAGVKTDSNSDLDAPRPGAGRDLPLDGERGVEAGDSLLEDGEHLVGAGFDLAAAGGANGRAKQASYVGEKPVVAIAQAPDQTGRVLDVGEQKRQEAGGKRARLG